MSDTAEKILNLDARQKELETELEAMRLAGKSPQELAVKTREYLDAYHASNNEARPHVRPYSDDK
jgi:outer membrane murein-binding lipoprotein Lpp